VGERFFWYRPTRVVPDKGPLNGCVCVCVCVANAVLLIEPSKVAVRISILPVTKNQQNPNCLGIFCRFIFP